MELNHIELPASLLTELYKFSLIETPKDKPFDQREKNPSDIQWKYLGNNQKNILLIVDYKDAVHLPDEQLDLLTNMLSACKLSLGDVSIVNINNHRGVFYREFCDFFKSKIVFLFGIDPVSLGLPVSFPQFQVQSFSGQTYLFTPPLNEIEENKVNKSKLWVCLRRIFGI